MDFRTIVPVIPSEHQITHSSVILSVGSCFAVHLSQKLSYFKFIQSVNHLGILFSPDALLQYFKYLCSEKDIDERYLVKNRELWNYFDAHSLFSAPDREFVLDGLVGAVESGRQVITKASHIFITLGTAWVYRHKVSGNIVANCHKIPQSEFTRELMRVDQVEASIREILSLIKTVNPKCHVVFTVSPVRHIKDGFAGNNRSKAHLIAALHSLLEADNTLLYFPSYEIMIDELRDYRYYADDLLHPSPLALKYIWERFSEMFFSKDTQALLVKVDAIQKSLQHRPFNASTSDFTVFQKKLQDSIDAISPLLPTGAFE